MALRWGIVYSDELSYDFCYAISTLSDLDHEVVAIAANSIEGAREFASAHHIRNVHEDFSQLAYDPDVEVVFVATNNESKYEVARLMLENGKHVLVETPMCRDARQARQLIMYAERKKLFLIEAIWSRFFPSYEYLRRKIRSDALGTIRKVDIELGCDVRQRNCIVKNLLDARNVQQIGVLAVQFCDWIFELPPRTVTATGEVGDDGSDLSMTAELCFGDNVSATILASAVENLTNRATIVGTNGQITIDNLFVPTTLIDIDGSPKTWPLPQSNLPFSDPAAIGLRYEAEEVRRCIRAKLVQSDSFKHNDNLIIANIEEDIRRQLAVVVE